MSDKDFETQIFEKQALNSQKIREDLTVVYDALAEKGYNPTDQIIGYILSGDPTYITSHNDARNIIQSLERDILLAELLRYYLDK
ncbi:MAG: IreB family regulatory phosphoprotein [Tissierellia bacterium]|nr:IreB family regulatory phosphoprotein [Tissierellia bacterium]